MDDGRRVKYLQKRMNARHHCGAFIACLHFSGERDEQIPIIVSRSSSFSLSLSARSGLNLRFRKQEMIWCGSLVFLFTFEEFCKSDTHNFLLTQTNWLWLTGHTRNNHNRTYPPQWCAKFLTNNRRVCINFQTNRTMTRIIRLTVRGASSWPWKNLMSNWIKCGCADKSVCGG